MTANAAELGDHTKRAKPKRVIPGFGLTLGYSITYLSLLSATDYGAVKCSSN